MITSFAERRGLFQLFFIFFHFLQEVRPVVALAQVLGTVFLHEISMLFDIVHAQMVGVEQIGRKHGGIIYRLIVIAAFINADLDADAAQIAARFWPGRRPPDSRPHHQADGGRSRGHLLCNARRFCFRAACRHGERHCD